MSTAAGAQAASSLAADARSLNELKRGAKTNPDQALRQAAAQFEAVFMNMLMKSMRESLPQNDPLNTESTRMFTGMLDQQYAQGLSGKGAGKGLGLAEMMVKQLSKNQVAPAGVVTGVNPAHGMTPGGLKAKLESATRDAGLAPQVKGMPANPAGPQDFIRRNLDSAIEAQKSSGIPAHFILGQAALESGWGKREIRAADGTSAHNLFGIKATRDWKGATASVTTTEYIGGVPRKVVEKFRAYESYAEGFRDYANLMAKNPRYAQVIGEQRDAASFAKSMQAAGYATDPLYAQKLTRVINQTLSMQGVA
ncbi:MAG: flagellar assembly peptidoglycan hydrolase FlgJ [Burkholderiales bacterium]